MAAAAAGLPSTVHGATSSAAPPASSSEVRVPPLPHVPANGFVRLRGLGSAASAPWLAGTRGAPIPTRVNAPISVLSHGSNNGDVHQSNEASPTNYRSNEAGTFQGIGQAQTVGALT